MDIHLRLVNRSADPDNTRVVVFRRLPDAGVGEEPVAWLVIDDFKPGDEHRFAYEIGLGDPSTDSPAIWVAAVPEAEPGGPLDIDPAAATELSLGGLRSAAIVMTGGGDDPDARRFEFRLEHQVSR